MVNRADLLCCRFRMGGQRVDFRTEENAIFDGNMVRYIDGRQTKLTLIPSEP